MKLFYLNEHKSCYNYARCVQEGFQYYTFDKGLEHEEELQNDCILFVLKGSLRLSCNEFQFTISAAMCGRGRRLDGAFSLFGRFARV